MAEGAWIFLSHSNKDFDKVRHVRDWLEGLKHHPLLFFLKCLESDSAELPALIEREIRARRWFILCDSENARRSEWVQREVAIIRELESEDHLVALIDLDDPALSADARLAPTLWQDVEQLRRRASAYLWLTNVHADVAERIRASLLKEDFGVFQLPEPDLLDANVAAEVREAAHNGTVVPVLGDDTEEMARRIMLSELEQLARRDRAANVVPLLVGSPRRVLSEARQHPYAHRLLAEGIEADPVRIPDCVRQLMRRLRSATW